MALLGATIKHWPLDGAGAGAGAGAWATVSRPTHLLVVE
jgi:hypothetical protein